jgi:hypothetical protein
VVVEKNVRIPERFFDNHYKSATIKAKVSVFSVQVSEFKKRRIGKEAIRLGSWKA